MGESGIHKTLSPIFFVNETKKFCTNYICVFDYLFISS